MRKVELLPTRDCEAGYSPVWKVSYFGALWYYLERILSFLNKFVNQKIRKNKPNQTKQKKN